MSLLSDTVFAGGSTRLHTGGGQRNAPRTVRKARSHAGFLSPLVQLVRDPVASLSGAVGNCRNVPDAAAPAVHVDRKPILYLRMKDVGCPDWLSAYHMLITSYTG